MQSSVLVLKPANCKSALTRRVTASRTIQNTMRPCPLSIRASRVSFVVRMPPAAIKTHSLSPVLQTHRVCVSLITPDTRVTRRDALLPWARQRPPSLISSTFAIRSCCTRPATRLRGLYGAAGNAHGTGNGGIRGLIMKLQWLAVN